MGRRKGESSRDEKRGGCQKSQVAGVVADLKVSLGPGLTSLCLVLPRHHPDHP